MQDHTSMRPMADPPDALGPRRSARESVIDQECYFEGTFRTPGNMRIEGAYQGVIECQGTLLIAETGRVNARIAAGNLTVAGQLEGEVLCESRFELLKTGRASGSIAARTTVVHDGAFFEGEIRMSDRPGELLGRGDASQRPRDTGTGVAGSGVAPTVPIRRRTSAESAGDSAALTEAPEGEEPAVAPRTNGRGQPAGSRETLPNRTSEP